MKKSLLFIALASLLVILAACSGSGSAETKNEDKTITIGVTGGPPEEITEVVKEVAKKEGIKLKIVKFNDIVTPNQALAKGQLDLNMFQTIQFLSKYEEDRKSNLVAIGSTYNSTLGVYSEKYESVDDIPDGATLGVPNDPVNHWRGLLIYEEAGLIKLNHEEGRENGTLNDIAENPKQFKFKEIDATLMLRTLNSIDAGIVASTTAFNNGLNPQEESIFLETNTNFPMVIASKEEDKDNPDYRKVTELYHSKEVKQYIEENYKDVIIVTDDPYDIH